MTTQDIIKLIESNWNPELGRSIIQLDQSLFMDLHNTCTERELTAVASPHRSQDIVIYRSRLNIKENDRGILMVGPEVPGWLKWFKIEHPPGLTVWDENEDPTYPDSENEFTHESWAKNVFTTTQLS